MTTGEETTYVVLPRGINVGGHHLVPMAGLRQELAASFGYVSTILQSGNIIVSSPVGQGPAVAETVRRVMAAKYGVDVPCLVRSAAEIAAIAALNPLAGVATDPSRQIVIFLEQAIDPASLAPVVPPEVVYPAGREVHVWHPDGVLAMTVSYQGIEKRSGIVGTARNWRTVKKIAAAMTA